MIPGLSLYRALGGALRLARLPDRTDAATVTATLGNALQAGLVIGGLALGLVVGARAVLALVGDRDALRTDGDEAIRSSDRDSTGEGNTALRTERGQSCDAS
jgi:hypothetical protein